MMLFGFGRRRRMPPSRRPRAPKIPKRKPKKPRVDDPMAFKTKVNEILKKVTESSAGEFAVSGELKDAPLCVISIKNKGNVHFPLLEAEAGNVIKSFEQSPFGRGTETIVDTSVRNSWQLSPKGFEILNTKWNIFINKTVLPQVGKDLGIVAPFTASLYKLLLYKAGSFFKTHRDSEKENGMFGTLVIQLPSKYKGGELVVTHDGKSKTIDYSSKGRTHREFSCFYSAFYCDCEHEILKVTEGYRVCLIYNLKSTETDQIPVALKTSGIEVELMKLFENWGCSDDKKEPAKLVFSLTHKYTEKNISLNNLKTSDKAVALLLISVASKCSLALKIGFFEKDSEGTENGFDGFDSDDSECYCEKTYTLNKLSCLDEEKRFPELTALTVDFDEEVIPSDCFDNAQPYSSKRQNTGNEGVQIELHYRSAALVLWPEDNILQVLGSSILNRNEIEKLFLAEFNSNFLKNDKKIQNKLLKWAKTVTNFNSSSSAMVETGIRSDNVIPLFKAIIAFGHLELVTSFMHRYLIVGIEAIPLIVSQCEKYGWKTFSDVLVASISRNCLEHFRYDHLKQARESISSSVEMLQLFVESAKKSSDPNKEEEKEAVFKLMLQSIVHNTTGCFTNDRSTYYRIPNLEQDQLQKINEEDKATLHTLFTLARKLNMISGLVEYSKNKRSDIVVPVLIRLAEENTEEKGILNEEWSEIGYHFISKMELFVSKPFGAPEWTKTENLWGCNCKDCKDVKAFLVSENEYRRFPIGIKRCNHISVEMRCRFDENELQAKTEKTGNTATLVITKTMKAQKAHLTNKNLNIKFLQDLKRVLPPHDAKKEEN